MAETVRIEIPIDVQDNTDPELANIAKGFNDVDAAAKKAQSSVNSASKKVTQFDKSTEKTQKSLSNWVKQKYELYLEAKDKASPVLDKLKSGVKTVAGKVWSVTMKAVDLATAPIRGVFNLLKNPLFQVGAVLGVSVGFKDTIDTYANFEAAMSQVSAISGATGTDLDKLTAKAKSMGATTKFTATEAAEGFNYMAMAGWKTQDMLDGIEGILNLAAASGEELGTTSDIVTDALTAFGLQAKDSTHFADVLAQTAASANTTVSGMGETFKYAGTMAGSLGYSIEDVALATGLMANAGLKGSMSGTALNSIFTRLSTNTNGARDAIEELGIQFFNSDGSARKLSDVMGELRSATANMTAEEKSAFANTVAGTQAQKGLLAILNASEKDYNDLAEAIGNADGASARMSETMLDNLQGSFTLLQSAVDGVKISLGERMAPYLKDLAEWLTGEMPAIEEGLMEFMDFVDVKVDGYKRKIKEFTSTEEWQNADFLGKVKIAWDELIANPFSEWWGSTGHQFFVEKAGDIGRGIGSAVSTGLLALLGIDVANAIDDGASVGSAFAKGLIDGFDTGALKDKLWSGIQGIFSNAAKILPGGEEANLSSWLSAAMIARVGAPLLGAGINTAKFSRVLFGTQTVTGADGNTQVVPGLGRMILGSAGSGTGILGFGANTAINLGAGNLAGGASLSAGALSALGLGATAGGVIGGIAVIDGGKDVYKAFTADNSNDKKLYGTRGATKLGMVGAGAAAGAAIGSVVPVLGTAVGGLIGAGIGGIGALLGGNKLADSISGVTSETEKLASRQEELAAVTSKMKQQNLDSHFGKIALSLADVKQVASSIIDIPTNVYMGDFTAALDTLSNMENSLASRTKTINKYMWKASVGVELTETELSDLQEQLDAYAQEAIDYVQEQQYTANLAIDLLITDASENSGFKEQINSYYEGITSELENLKSELNQAFQDAINIDGDGGAKITIDEAALISDLQQQIADITTKLSTSQFEAKMDVLQFKFSGADLDAESFAALQAELQAQVAETTAGYDQALEVGIANAKIMLEDGAIDQSQYDSMVQSLKEGYLQNVGDIEIKAASFQLDTLLGQFDEELEAAGLDEKVSEAIRNCLEQSAEALRENSGDAALNEALAEIWSEDNLRSMLGVDNIDATTAAVFSDLFEQLVPTAESLQQLVGKYDELGVTISDEVQTSISNALTNADLIGTISGDMDSMWGLIADEFNASCSRSFSEGESYQAMLNMLQQAGGEVPEALTQGLTENFNIDEATLGLGNSLASKLIENALQGIEGSGETIGPAITSEVESSISNATAGITAGSDIPAKVGENMTSNASNVEPGVQVISELASSRLLADFQTVGSDAGFEVPGLVSNNIGANAGNVLPGCELVRSTAASYLSNPIDVTTTANLTINWNVLNPTPPISGTTGVTRHATGGIMTSPHIGMVAEDGAEAIIPLGSKRRSRGLSLWERAGEILGVKKFAEGGIVGTPELSRNPLFAYEGINSIKEALTNEARTYNGFSDDNEDNVSVAEPVPVKDENGKEQKTEVKVNVQMTPTFQISGNNNDEDSIMRIVRAHLKEMTDEIGGELAERLEMVFSNMPVRGGA